MHHWCKLRLARKTSNDFSSAHASVNTLRQHGIHARAEKEVHSEKEAPRLRDRIRRRDFALRARHDPLSAFAGTDDATTAAIEVGHELARDDDDVDGDSDDYVAATADEDAVADAYDADFEDMIAQDLEKSDDDSM